MLVSPEDASARNTGPDLFRGHRRKPLALSLWLVLLGGYQLYTWRSGLSPSELGRRRALAGNLAAADIGVELRELRPATNAALVLAVLLSVLLFLP